jgi:hypothetical protein
MKLRSFPGLEGYALLAEIHAGSILLPAPASGRASCPAALTSIIQCLIVHLFGFGKSDNAGKLRKGVNFVGKSHGGHEVILKF